MIRECFRTNTGILFLTKSLRDISLDPESLYPEVIVRPEPLFTPPILPAVAKKQKRALTEEEADAIDALCPIYDQLRMKPFWWMLEVMPVKRWVRTEEKKWLKEYTYVFIFALVMFLLPDLTRRVFQFHELGTWQEAIQGRLRWAVPTPNDEDTHGSTGPQRWAVSPSSEVPD